MNKDSDIKEKLRTFFKDELKGEKTLTIISTYKLSDDDLALIRKIFSIPADFKIINLIDIKILGGLIFKFGSKIIDLSITGHLKNFKKLITL
ncbi:MAG: F0F1 ATP synthase subunit delta [Microgenomates group bacterium]